MSKAAQIVTCLLDSDALSREEILRLAEPPMIKWYVVEQDPEADSGELKDEGTEDMSADDIDREDGITPVDKAVEFLQHESWEASASHFHPGVWYIGEPDQDMRTGKYREKTFHLKNFTEEQEREIFDLLHPKKRPLAR